MHVSPTRESSAATSPHRSTRWSSRWTPRRPSRGLRLDCGGAREAPLVGWPRAACRLLLPARARSSSRLRTRARCAGAIRGSAQGRLGRAVALQRRAVEAVPLPGYVAQLGDLLGATGRKREAREQYGLVAAIERIQAANGSRIDLESALYRTDRGIRLARDARARPPRPRPPALGRRRRRARLGARAQRPLRRGAPLVAAVVAARDARCLVLLPPRDDRALPRPGRRRAALVPARARHEPALLAPLEPDRTEVRRMKRLLVTLAVLAALAAPASALAHPLGNFTVNRPDGDRALGRTRLRPLRARPGGDPDVPARHTRPWRRLRARGCERSRAPPRRPPLAAASARAAGLRTSGGRRAEDAALRRRLRRRGQRLPARVPRPQLRLADRLARGRRPRRGGSLAAVGERACRKSQRRPARVPERPAPLAARRHLGHRVLHARRRRRHAAATPRRGRGRPREGRLRVARLARRPLARSDPPLAADRVLLGRGPRAHARATARRSSPGTSWERRGGPSTPSCSAAS